MTLAPQIKKHKGAITAVVAFAVVILGVVLFGNLKPEPAAQQLRVSIVGGAGGVVTVDGEPHQLTAYNGTDSGKFEVRKTIYVSVTSAGAAPSCTITDATGVILTDKTGSTPQWVEQTTGWGTDTRVFKAPTLEMVSCSFTVG